MSKEKIRITKSISSWQTSEPCLGLGAQSKLLDRLLLGILKGTGNFESQLLNGHLLLRWSSGASFEQTTVIFSIRLCWPYLINALSRFPCTWLLLFWEALLGWPSPSGSLLLAVCVNACTEILSQVLCCCSVALVRSKVVSHFPASPNWLPFVI